MNVYNVQDYAERPIQYCDFNVSLKASIRTIVLQSQIYISYSLEHLKRFNDLICQQDSGEFQSLCKHIQIIWSDAFSQLFSQLFFVSSYSRLMVICYTLLQSVTIYTVKTCSIGI